MIDQVDAPHFNVILRRNNNLRISFQVMVPTTEFSTTLRENCLIRFWNLRCGLVSGRPVICGLKIPDVTERSPVIADAVLTPACQCGVATLAVTPAGLGDHYVVPPVGKQLH